MNEMQEERNALFPDDEQPQSLALLRKAVSEGANVEDLDEHRRTPLHAAVSKRLPKVIAVLRHYGARAHLGDFSVTDDMSLCSALIAPGTIALQCIQALWSTGFDSDEQDLLDMTLFYALNNQLVNATALLLLHGFDSTPIRTNPNLQHDGHFMYGALLAQAEALKRQAEEYFEAWKVAREQRKPEISTALARSISEPLPDIVWLYDRQTDLTMLEQLEAVRMHGGG